MKSKRSITAARSISVGLIFLLCSSAFACRIPVFRYALERWPPGTFELVIAHAGPLTAEQSALVESISRRVTDKEQLVNLRVELIDVASESMPRPQRALLASTGLAPSEITTPQATLLFPRSRGETVVAWQGELAGDNIAKLLDSPARRQTVDYLLDGESAVWVLIEGSDAAANDAAAEMLETELARVAELIELPPQEVIEADEEFQAGTAVELRIGFQLLRLRRDDPKEAAFIEILLNSESDLSTFDEPIAIPIFGRGRTYYALVGKGIKPKLIEANSRFVCGDCSCQVKEENPGSDLLMAANWDEGIRGSAFPEQELPELTGIGSLDVIDLAEYERNAATEATARRLQGDVKRTEATTNDAAATTGAASIQDLVDDGSEDIDSADRNAPTATSDVGNLDAGMESSSSPIWRSLVPVIGLAVLIAVVGALALRF